MNGKHWLLILGTVILTQFFEKRFYLFIRPVGPVDLNSTYGIYYPFGVRLINRLRFGFSNLPELKFRHNFADTVNPLCSCTFENNFSAKTTYLLVQPS